MFNNSGFNQMPFNRGIVLDLLFSVKMDGEGSMDAALSMLYTMSVKMDGEGEMVSDFVREISNAVKMDGEGGMSTSFLREMNFGTRMEAEGELLARMKKFHVESVTIQGPFAPGDVLILDTAKYRVMKNGVVVGYDGELFEINPGVNTITYQDSETGRNVLIRVSYRDRYLY